MLFLNYASEIIVHSEHIQANYYLLIIINSLKNDCKMSIVTNP